LKSQTSHNNRSLDTNEILFYKTNFARMLRLQSGGSKRSSRRPIAVIEQSGPLIGEMSTMLNAPPGHRPAR
jgi:hypothetical protein